MSHSVTPAESSWRDDRIVVLLAAGLSVVAAVAYASLRLAYAYALVPVSAYGLLSGAVVWGSVFVGAAAAGVAGYAGWRARAGVLAGTAPALGVSLGSLLSVAAGLGDYDARPFALLGATVLSCTAIVGVAWLAGKMLQKAR